MKVLQFGMEWFADKPGGLSRFYSDLLGQLPGLDIDYRGLLVGSGQAETATDGRIRSFAPASASMFQRLNGARRLGSAMLHDMRPDVVASHFALYTLPCLPSIGRRPLVVHFHGPWAAEGDAEGNQALSQIGKLFVENRVYRRATLLIVLSEAFSRVLQERYGVEASRIRVVPGGVDASRFDSDLSRAAARETLDWPAERQIVLCVRRLVNRMGLENLVVAAEIIRRRHPDVLFLLAGRGPLAAALQRQIDEAGLTRHFRLLGFVPDVNLPLAYRAADLSIAPTVALEGFGLITLESLAAGTPVLVTPVGGLPEAVSGLDPALVLAGSAVHDLVDGLDGALSGKMPLPDAAACRRYVRENFDWPVIARKINAVYEEALTLGMPATKVNIHLKNPPSTN